MWFTFSFFFLPSALATSIFSKKKKSEGGSLFALKIVTHFREILSDRMKVILWKCNLDISLLTLEWFILSMLCIWKRKSSVVLPLRIVIHSFIPSKECILSSLIFLESNLKLAFTVEM